MNQSKREVKIFIPSVFEEQKNSLVCGFLFFSLANMVLARAAKRCQLISAQRDFSFPGNENVSFSIEKEIFRVRPTQLG